MNPHKLFNCNSVLWIHHKKQKIEMFIEAPLTLDPSPAGGEGNTLVGLEAISY